MGSLAVLALDIGSSKISALLARAGESGLDVMGLGRAPSRGVRRGMVFDVEEASAAICEAVDQIGPRARQARAWVALGGPHFAGANAGSRIAIARPSREIAGSDVEQALRAAGEVSPAEGREVVHVTPSDFVVDGMPGVRNPAGLSASTLEARVHVVTASSAALDNAEKCLQRAAVTLEDFVFAPLASAEAAFGLPRPRGPHLLIDIGAATTGYVLFSETGPVLSGSLPLGGIQIAQDVCVGLRLPVEASVRLLEGVAVGLAALARGQAPVTVPGADGGERRVAPLALAEIVEERLREILSQVRVQVVSSGLAPVITGGAIIAGGVSRIPGTVALAEQVLSCPVCAYGSPLAGLFPDAALPELAAVVGAATIGLRQSSRTSRAERAQWLRSLGARFERVKRAVLGS